MSSDERAIRDLVATWMDASRRGDIAAILPLMADDVAFFVHGRAPIRGRYANLLAPDPLGGTTP